MLYWDCSHPNTLKLLSTSYFKMSLWNNVKEINNADRIIYSIWYSHPPFHLISFLVWKMVTKDLRKATFFLPLGIEIWDNPINLSFDFLIYVQNQKKISLLLQEFAFSLLSFHPCKLSENLPMKISCFH